MPEANAWLKNEFAASDPELYAFASGYAAKIVDVVCQPRHYDVDPKSDMDALLLQDAFSRLIFTFTNPQNYADSISTKSLQLVLDDVGSDKSKTPFSSFVAGVNGMSIQFAANVPQFRKSGDFNGLTYDEQFLICRQSYIDAESAPRTHVDPANGMEVSSMDSRLVTRLVRLRNSSTFKTLGSLVSRTMRGRR